MNSLPDPCLMIIHMIHRFIKPMDVISYIEELQTKYLYQSVVSQKMRNNNEVKLDFLLSIYFTAVPTLSVCLSAHFSLTYRCKSSRKPCVKTYMTAQIKTSKRGRILSFFCTLYI